MREKLESFKQEEQQPLNLDNLETIRDRVLVGLRLGRQAPEYKRTKATLNKFISELRSQ